MALIVNLIIIIFGLMNVMVGIKNLSNNQLTSFGMTFGGGLINLAVLLNGY